MSWRVFLYTSRVVLCLVWCCLFVHVSCFLPPFSAAAAAVLFRPTSGLIRLQIAPREQGLKKKNKPQKMAKNALFTVNKLIYIESFNKDSTLKHFLACRPHFPFRRCNHIVWKYRRFLWSPRDHLFFFVVDCRGCHMPTITHVTQLLLLPLRHHPSSSFIHQRRLNTTTCRGRGAPNNKEEQDRLNSDGMSPGKEFKRGLLKGKIRLFSVHVWYLA